MNTEPHAETQQNCLRVPTEPALQVQSDAHVPQLFDGQQRGDDVLTEPVVDQNLHENTDRVSAPTGFLLKILRGSVTFHTGSAAVFFRGGVLKFSIRLRATADARTHNFNTDNGAEHQRKISELYSALCQQFRPEVVVSWYGG